MRIMMTTITIILQKLRPLHKCVRIWILRWSLITAEVIHFAPLLFFWWLEALMNFSVWERTLRLTRNVSIGKVLQDKLPRLLLEVVRARILLYLF